MLRDMTSVFTAPSFMFVICFDITELWFFSATLGVIDGKK